MSTATEGAYQMPGAGRLAVKPVSLPRVIQSEWIKLRSLRSTIWTLLAAVVIIIGLGLIISASQASRRHGSDFDPLVTSLGGTFLAQLAIGVLGVLMITGEYATGSSRSTFAAVPRRLPVLWGKAILYSVVAFLVTLVASLIAFFGGQAALSKENLNVSLSDPGVFKGVIGAPLYLVLVGLLGLGLGAIIRHSAGSIAALFAIIFILPIIFSLLPSNWNDAVSDYLPLNLGQSLFQLREADNTLSWGAALGVLVLYAAVLLAIGAVRLKRRDV